MSSQQAGISAQEPLDADEKAGDSTDLHLTRRLLGYVMQHKGLFGVALLIYPLTAAGVAVPPYLVHLILDEAIPARDLSQLHLLAGIYAAAVIIEYATGIASQFAMTVLGQRAMRSMRGQLFERVQRLPAGFFDRNPIGRILTRLTNDVEALGEVFATGAVTVLGDFVSIAAIVGMMLWLDPHLTLYAFLVVPPVVGLTAVFRVYARRAFRDIRYHLAKINTFLSEHLTGMHVVQLFGQQQRTLDEFRERNVQYRDANRSAIFFDALLFSLVEAIGTAAAAVVIWFGADDLATGAIKAGTLVAFIQYIRRFFIPIRDLSTKYTVLQSGFAAAERIFRLLDEPADIPEAEAPIRVSEVRDAVELDQVSFAYREDPQEKDWILKNISLRVNRGEKVAIVGATGSGKSTILKVINRSYDVQQGAVRIDGVDVRELHLNDVRRLFGIVLQDVYLFSGTVMDNLKLVAPSGAIDESSVVAAAKAVRADEFIQRLPKKYDTEIQQMASNFSAGERQLLAFARALVADPAVLILDEATSNVDSKTEARIQEAMEVLLKDRTAIIIAHRLSTIRQVDRIIVLQAGEVVEDGDHDSLIRNGGLYAKLVELQFGGA